MVLNKLESVHKTKQVVKLGFDKYHLIRTPVFTSFKPPSAQSEASRMGGGSTSAVVSRKITSAIEYFLIEEISAQVYTKMATAQSEAIRMGGDSTSADVSRKSTSVIIFFTKF